MMDKRKQQMQGSVDGASNDAGDTSVGFQTMENSEDDEFDSISAVKYEKAFNYNIPFEYIGRNV
jgi:hypothetical protein